MKDFLRNAKEFAQTKNGDCLSLTYHKAKDNLIWKCSNNKHPEFKMSYFNAVKNQRWCPLCKTAN